jgi:O-methyltransferase
LRGRSDHSTLISAATYSPWRIDRDFHEVFEIVRNSTLLDEMRLYELWRLAGQVRALDGDAMEVGCWRGGAGCLIAKRIAEYSPTARTYLCDTFAGVVKAGAEDPTYRGGEHADASSQAVEALGSRLNLQALQVLVGIFPEETGTMVQTRRFKFVHMDLDVYQGSRDAFEWLLPRLVIGSIVFDDYGFALTGGARKFVDELENNPDFVIVRNLNGHAVVVRRSATNSTVDDAGPHKASQT